MSSSLTPPPPERLEITTGNLTRDAVSVPVQLHHLQHLLMGQLGGLHYLFIIYACQGELLSGAQLPVGREIEGDNHISLFIDGHGIVAQYPGKGVLGVVILVIVIAALVARPP